jgi:hypothetical protein
MGGTLAKFPFVVAIDASLPDARTLNCRDVFDVWNITVGAPRERTPPADALQWL